MANIGCIKPWVKMKELINNGQLLLDDSAVTKINACCAEEFEHFLVAIRKNRTHLLTLKTNSITASVEKIQKMYFAFIHGLTSFGTKEIVINYNKTNYANILAIEATISKIDDISANFIEVQYIYQSTDGLHAEQLIEIITNGIHQGIKKISLNGCCLATLNIKNFHKLIDACRARQGISIRIADQYNNNLKKFFIGYNYKQQQKLALDYLHLLLPTGKGIINLPSDIISFLPFNLTTNPDAFYELLLKFIATNKNEHTALLLLKECNTKKLVAKEKLFKILIDLHINEMKIENFNSSDFSIENICRLISNFALSLDAACFLMNHSSFENFIEKQKIIHAIFSIFEQISFTPDFPLNFSEAIEITTLLKAPAIVNSYLQIHNDTLNPEQKNKLISLCSGSNAYVLIPNLNLTKEGIINACKQAKSLCSLIPALLKLGMSKPEILQTIEENLKDYIPHAIYNISLLNLNKYDIVAFVNRNPEWAHLLDEWVTSPEAKLLSPKETQELFELRITNSSFYLHNVDGYQIADEDLSKLLCKASDSEIYINHSFLKSLTWQDKYKYICKVLEKEPGQILYSVQPIISYKDNRHLDSYLKSMPEYEDIDMAEMVETSVRTKYVELFTTSINKFCQLISGEHLKDALTALYSKLFNIQDSLEHHQLYFNKFSWWLTLSSQTLVEVEFNRILYCFSQRSFIKVLEEIAALADPYFCTKAIRPILELLKNPQKFDNFCMLLQNSNTRSQIPALIIATGTQNPLVFSHLLKFISADYKDSKNFKVLLNGLESLLHDITLSDEQKIKLANKILSFDLQLHTVSNSEELQCLHSNIKNKLSFNRINISQIANTIQFGLLAYDIQGRLIDLQDIATDPRLQPLHAKLKIWTYHNKSLTKVKKEIIDIITKIRIFPCGLQTQMQAFVMLQGLSITNNIAAVLDDPKFQTKSWMAIYSFVLKTLFELSSAQQVDVQATLDRCREQFSIVAYYSRLKNLGAQARPYIEMLKLYVRLISSPKAHNFYNYRYNLEHQPHMKSIFTKKHQDLSAWRNGFNLNYNDFYLAIKDVQTPSATHNLNSIDFIMRQICHFQHLPVDRFAFIHQFFTAKSDTEKVAIYDTTKKRLQMFDKAANGGSNHRTVLNLQVALMEYCNIENTLDEKTKVVQLLRILNICEACNEIEQFYGDISHYIGGIWQKIENSNKTAIKPQDTTNWQIIDTDHFWDMFLIGTDVIGSCQNVNGTPSLNRCLIGGYVLSGHIRQIAIKNTEGSIIARAIFRLMRDKHTKTPVLFLEEVYPNLTNEAYGKAIRAFAVLRAWQLGWALITSDTSQFSYQYENPIEVTAVKVAEYVDAIGTPQQDKYEINNGVVMLHTPQLRINWQRQLADYGMLMGRASYGPRPLGSVTEFVAMYNNYRKTIDPKINPAKFIRKLNLQLTNG